MNYMYIQQEEDSVTKRIATPFNLALYLSRPLKYQVFTQEGREVQIIHTKKAGTFCIVGLIKTNSGEFDLLSVWDANGNHDASDSNDIHLVDSFAIEGFEIVGNIAVRPIKRSDDEVFHYFCIGKANVVLNNTQVEQLHRRLQQYAQQIETFNKE